jgi:vacuolar-type H+-ATPase subunit E/Vma4
MTLVAVQDAALEAARADADALLSSAAERAGALLAAARSEALAMVDARSAAAERLADQERQARLAVARAEARSIVLRAQRSVLAGATAEAHAAARRLVSDPRYEPLIKRLTVEAHERLSPAGTVAIVAAPGGGLLARAGSREIDYSLDAQVDRSLETLSGELERLWQ